MKQFAALAAVAWLLMVALIAVGGWYGHEARTEVTSEVAAEPRLVVVSEAPQSAPLNENPDIVSAVLISGSLPPGRVSATVLTDTNCQPDANNLSHCLNEIQIGDAKITVQHHHDMHVVPCLTPYEKVEVVMY